MCSCCTSVRVLCFPAFQTRSLSILSRVLIRQTSTIPLPQGYGKWDFLLLDWRIPARRQNVPLRTKHCTPDTNIDAFYVGRERLYCQKVVLQTFFRENKFGEMFWENARLRKDEAFFLTIFLLVSFLWPAHRFTREEGRKDQIDQENDGRCVFIA